jgi:CMP-N-acetylneuraminic acid synthetase
MLSYIHERECTRDLCYKRAVHNTYRMSHFYHETGTKSALVCQTSSVDQYGYFIVMRGTAAVERAVKIRCKYLHFEGKSAAALVTLMPLHRAPVAIRSWP